MIKRVSIAFGVLVILAAAAYFYFPAFSVNGNFIFRSDVQKQTLAAQTFYKNLAAVYGVKSTDQDTELQIINGDIENELIREELQKDIKDSTLVNLINSKLKDLEAGGALQKAGALYGLSPKETENFIFLPAIRQDLLKSQFILKNVDFDSWLLGAKKTAKVIFFGKLKWDGESAKRI